MNKNGPTAQGKEIVITLPIGLLKNIDDELADPKTWFEDRDDFFRFAALKTLDQHRRTRAVSEQMRTDQWSLRLICPDVIYKNSSETPDSVKINAILDKTLTEIIETLKQYLPGNTEKKPSKKNLDSGKKE